jgi:hypothetical protein
MNIPWVPLAFVFYGYTHGGLQEAGHWAFWWGVIGVTVASAASALKGMKDDAS